MQVKVLLFGPLRERVGKSQLIVNVPDGASLRRVMELLKEQYPLVESFLPRCRWAVNCKYSSLDACLQEGDEVALISPVSGGSSSIPKKTRKYPAPRRKGWGLGRE